MASGVVDNYLAVLQNKTSPDDCPGWFYFGVWPYQWLAGSV
jgi:hypothetical protein